MTIWDWLRRAVIGLVMAAVLGGGVVLILSVIPTENQLRKQIYALDLKLQEQKQLARQLQAMLEAVERDSNTVERLARERLGLGRTNETIFRFDEPKSR
jgi:cell division protein FtsB